MRFAARSAHADGAGAYELWHLTLEDTIDTVGRAFMGLTLKCARCHDQKFDPITTRGYHALSGIASGDDRRSFARRCLLARAGNSA